MILFFLIFRSTGAGCLSPAMLFVSFVIGTAIAEGVAPDDFPSSAAGLIIVAVILAGAPVHWLVGYTLNSEQTPQGRVWHNRHRFVNTPVQLGAAGHVLLGLVGTAFVVGASTSDIAGWVLLISVLVGALVVYLRYESRRQLRSVDYRKDLARIWGWRYKDSDPLLPLRWKAFYGRMGAFSMNPFGVLGGELGGLPFTVFDTERFVEGDSASTKERLRQTTWAVHLPVAYPRIAVYLSSSEAGKEFVVEADDTGFKQALWTPEIRQATQAHHLFGWHIEGRDLMWSDAPEASFGPDEIVQIAERLVALAHLLPADLAERYGTKPTTDVPYAIADPTALDVKGASGC